MKKIIFVYILLYSFTVLAQNEPKSIGNDIVIPSPTAFELGKNGNTPTSLFSGGKPNVSIPIYNYKLKNFTLPITLSYASNGIRVDQMETNMGLTWVLNAGGVISKIVRGLEDTKVSMSLPNEDITSAEMIFKPENKDFFVWASEAGDHIYDEYSFNFLNYNGKFFIKNGEVIQIEKSDLKIVYHHFGDDYFEIITPDGIKFFFKDIEKTTIYPNSCSLDDNRPVSAQIMFHDTSFYLSKIELLTTEEINFQYADVEYNYNPFVSQSLDVFISHEVPFPGCVDSPIITIPPKFRNCSSKYKVNGKVLNKISTNNPIYGEIEINSNVNHMDVHGYKLTNEIVVKKDYEVMEKINFSYLSTSNGRFFLEKVEFKDPSNYYMFEYIEPQDFPKRLSLSQDLWGLYNGSPNISFITKNIDCYDPGDPNSVNRMVDEKYAMKGLLKKVVYPTKGYSEFFYESNRIEGTTNRYKSFSTSDEFNVDNHSFTPPLASNVKDLIYTKTFTVGNVQSCGSTISAGNFLYNEDYPQGYIDGEPIHGNLSSTVTLHNDTDNEYVQLEDRSSLNMYINTSTNESASMRRTMDLLSNKTYTLKVKASKCLTTKVDIFFSELDGVENHIKMGGLRLKKKIDKTDSNDIGNIVNYYYGSKDSLTISSGEVFEELPILKAPTSVKLLCLEQSSVYFFKKFTTYHSNSLISLMNNGVNICYKYVTESFGGANFEKGGIEHKYNVNYDSPSQNLIGDVPHYNYTSNTGIGHGSEIATTFLKKNSNSLNKVREIRNSFEINPNKYNEYFCYDISLKFAKFQGDYPSMQTLDFLNVEKIRLISYQNFLKTTSTTDYFYDSNNILIGSLTDTTSYDYNKPNHLQLSRQITTNSRNETLETKYYYPKDDEMVFEPFVNDLISKNIIGTPLKTVTLKNKEKLSEQKTEYIKTADNLLLPKFVYANKGSTAIDLKLDKKITYDQYDDKGNILQYTLENGIPVSIVWGYNKTQPIAKIENVSYSSIQNTIVNLQNLSNSDNDNCLSANCEEKLLRDELNTLRTPPSNEMVTSYTYDPLIGITSITDPKGLTSYYEYDQFNRLKFIKDQDLNVLQRYCYNYKGQVIDCSQIGQITFFNSAKSGSFTRNNCVAGGTSTPVIYNVAANTYTSTISLADADSKAQNDVTSNGQTYANANGTCTFNSVAKSGSFTKNNCTAGGTSSPVIYNVAASTYTSTISQADADSKAQNDVNSNGQTYANTNGMCIPPAIFTYDWSETTSQGEVIINVYASTTNHNGATFNVNIYYLHVLNQNRSIKNSVVLATGQITHSVVFRLPAYSINDVQLISVIKN